MAFRSPTISDSVPLPQSYRGRRVLEMSAGLDADDWTEQANTLGVNLAAEVPTGQGPDSPVNASRYLELFRDLLSAQGSRAVELIGLDTTSGLLDRHADEGEIAPNKLTELLDKRQPLRIANRTAIETIAPPPGLAGGGFGPFGPFGPLRGRLQLEQPLISGGIGAITPLAAAPPPAAAAAAVGDASAGGAAEVTGEPPEMAAASLPAVAELSDGIAALARGRYLLPIKKWPGHIQLIPYLPRPESNPTIFLIEEYGVSSMLGNFGIDRPVGGYSLFPGETTEITLKTWLTTTESVTEGSSIIDSFSTTAADKFNTQLEQTASDKSTLDMGSSYSNEWHASGGFSFIVTASGGGGETRSSSVHAGRETFATQTKNALHEHSSTSNANRQSNVTGSKEREQTVGSEQVTIRTLRNVNMRHCLNIVFCELNQEHITRVHLTGLKLGFQNGRVGSWREAPLSGMREFVEQFVAAAKVDAVCQVLLKNAAIVFDSSDTPVSVLDLLEWTDTSVESSTPERDPNGDYPIPGEGRTYRFKRGQLGDQELADGVVLSETNIVMRTGTLIYDALLSPGEALDEYAMDRQKADSEAAGLANRRTEELNKAAASSTERMASIVAALNDITDGKERMEAYAAAFRPIVVDGDEVALDGENP